MTGAVFGVEDRGMAADDEHVRGALVALERAEGLALQIRRGLRLRAVRDQFALTARAEDAEAMPETFRAYLWLPGWTWMMFAALAVVFSMPVPGVALGVAAAAAAVAALLLRTALAVGAAPRLFVPEQAARRSLQAALVEAGAHLQAVGTSDPYRGQPLGWSGDDPAASSRPWTELGTIRRTAEALRRRALPAAKGDTNGG